MAQFHDSGHAPLVLRYCDHHDFFLPDGHKFPLAKYRLLRERLQGDPSFRLESSELASRADVLRVHEPEYVNGLLAGTLEGNVMRRIGLPWSPELVSRTLASVGGTLLATQTGIRTGFGGTLAGGTHHGFRGAGSGFCVFNDLAIAIAWARAKAAIKRAAVVDLDVHQGDGTAAIFKGDPGVFTLSLHGARNFPFHKQASTLDVELPDGTGDETYLAALQPALERVWQFAPELVLFQAGVDALASDRLGRLSLTLDGLRQRDSLVMGGARRRGVPLVVTIGGGYSDPIEQTVAAHAQTFRTAAALHFLDSVSPRDAP